MVRRSADLPAGVALEWASWCRDPDYVVGALSAQTDYARFRAPLRVVHRDRCHRLGLRLERTGQRKQPRP